MKMFKRRARRETYPQRGWAEEMDRKLREMVDDPEGYFKRARKRARRG